MSFTSVCMKQIFKKYFFKIHSMLSKNKLVYLMMTLVTLFISGCSSSSKPPGTGPIATGLKNFSEGLYKILFTNDQVLLGLMFVAVLFGSFALFKALLRFSFRESNQFKNKEINVISFMISFIGTSGIFYLFKDGSSTKTLITLFGDNNK